MEVFELLIMYTVLLPGICSAVTTISINSTTQEWYINGKPTYNKNSKMQGLIMNARLIQGVFDDDNNSTVKLWKYPDTGKWDPDRNTNEFISSMLSWKKNGMIAFTVGMQGGSPYCYGNKGWIVSAFYRNGTIKNAWLDRLKRILDKADELGMIPIVQYFYAQQFAKLDQHKIPSAVQAMTEWLVDTGHKGFLVEAYNEKCSDSETLNMSAMIRQIQQVSHDKGHRLLVSTSCSGGGMPKDEVIGASDFILLHGNGQDPSAITKLINKVRSNKVYQNKPTPIVFNEDDHGHFDQTDSNLQAAVRGKASWGLLCCCDSDTSGDYNTGYQCPPVNWGTKGPCLLPGKTPGNGNKEDFFSVLKNMTDL